jgi:hypothetical protein
MDWGKHRNKSVRIAGILAQIRTQNLPNRSIERYRYINPLGSLQKSLAEILMNLWFPWKDEKFADTWIVIDCLEKSAPDLYLILKTYPPISLALLPMLRWSCAGDFKGRQTAKG